MEKNTAHLSIIPYYYLEDQPKYKSYFQFGGVYMNSSAKKEDILGLLEDWSTDRSKKLLMGSVGKEEVIDSVCLTFYGKNTYHLKVFIRCPDQEKEVTKFLLDNLDYNYDPGVIVGMSGLSHRPPMVWRHYFETLYSFLENFKTYSKISHTFDKDEVLKGKEFKLSEEDFICAVLRFEDAELNPNCLSMYGLRLPWLIDFYFDSGESFRLPDGPSPYTFKPSSAGTFKFKMLKKEINTKDLYYIGNILSDDYKITLDIYAKGDQNKII